MTQSAFAQSSVIWRVARLLLGRTFNRISRTRNIGAGSILRRQVTQSVRPVGPTRWGTSATGPCVLSHITSGTTARARMVVLHGEIDDAQQNHWSECGRATRVANSGGQGRPHRSVQSLGFAITGRIDSHNPSSSCRYERLNTGVPRQRVKR